MRTKRVLVVDDDHRICRIVEKVAEKVGIESFAIEDPTRFETSVRFFQPDLIIIDLQMDSVDGVKLVRGLAKVGTEATIVLTSGYDPRVLRAGTALGRSLGLTMSEPLCKPIEITALRQRLLEEVGTVSCDDADEIPPMTAARLERAIHADEIEVHYQPIVELATGELRGVEALARWRHPEHGLLEPERFIELAERTELIRPLTSRVLGVAVETVARWRERLPDLELSINLSQAMLGELDLPDRVLELLHFYAFPPGALTLEVTETCAAQDITRAMDVLTRLRLKGVRLAVDDFGTGTASLDQLYRMPYDVLKIDRSFVMDIERSREAATIVRSTIELAKSYGLDVVAEGVESETIRARLAGFGCGLGQGFVIARALDSREFLGWATRRERTNHTLTTPAPAPEPIPEPEPRGVIRADALVQGTNVNWYRVDSVLGAGGFGITYLATDTNLDQPVAVKEYLPRDLASRGPHGDVEPLHGVSESDYRRGLDWFIAEARTLARFRHPNIVRVYSVFEQRGTAYMVMDYESGAHLARAMRLGHSNDEESLLNLVRPLLDGLSRVHAAGFIHRDIKPENIIIGGGGRPVLLDFGCARKTLDITAATAFVTHGFSPIEQYDPTADDRRQGPWTDIYSLGATLYRMIIRRGPIDAVSRANALIARREDIHASIVDLAPEGYSRAFLEAIDCALAFHPQDRPQSVAEWLEMLSSPITTAPPSELRAALAS